MKIEDTPFIQVAEILSARHIHVAKPLLILMSIIGALLGIVLFSGGIALAYANRLAPTEIILFGNTFKSSSIGVALCFIGALVTVLTIRRILKSLGHLAALPD